MSNVKVGTSLAVPAGAASLPLPAVAGPPEPGRWPAGAVRRPGLPSAHAQVFERFAERRRLVFCLRPAVDGRYELLLLAPILDLGGSSYADTQAWNAACRKRLGACPAALDPACAEMTGRIEMILAALDDDAAGIAPLEHDIRPRPGGLADADFPATLFLPHPIGDASAQCQVENRYGLYELLHTVHEAGLVLDIDPGWRTLSDAMQRFRLS